MHTALRSLLYFTLLILATSLLPPAWSCTGLQVKAKDGSYVNGRTVEFGIPLDLSGLVIPRNYEFQGTLPDGKTGLTYKAKYAVVGGAAFGSSSVLDGLNEKGLAAGAFYFPGYAGYATINAQNSSQAIAPTEFVNWVLTQFASIDEVKQGLKSIVIAPTALKQWGGVPPFHYVVYDKQGNSLVIEPINGQLKTYDNPIGVFTNSPTFDWHITNLSNYINLTPINAPAKNIDGLQLKSFGQGSGLHGLPGDFTPPSRFIRAAIFAYSAVPTDNADQAVQQVFHLLNQFDIPVGAVRDEEGNRVFPESTIATTVKDPEHLKYYFKTYDDQTIKMINLNTFKLDDNSLKTISMKGTTPVVDISMTAKSGLLAIAK